MRIACIRTYRLACALDRPFYFSQWGYSERQALLIRVTADSGAEGWGECYGPAAVSQAAVTTWYAPRILGMEALRADQAWDHMWRTSLDFARRGVMMGAISGIDMALWDLRGRVLGLPACDLMGGRVRERVPCYATGMYFDESGETAEVDRLLDEAAGYRDLGFEAMKIKVGRNPRFDAGLIPAFRRAFPDLLLMADANHAYDLPEAERIARLLLEHGYSWFEEPLSPEHPALYRRLRDSVPLPLAAGECEQTRYGFQSLLGAGGVDVAQPDLAFCGGPSEALKIRALASSLGINVVPHVWGTMFNLAAAAHFLSSDYRQPGRAEPAPGRLECDRTPNPLRDEIFRIPVRIQDGHAAVPSTPGLGVELDVAAMEGYCVAAEEVS